LKRRKCVAGTRFSWWARIKIYKKEKVGLKPHASFNGSTFFFDERLQRGSGPWLLVE
jgi:hypothetical protein